MKKEEEKAIKVLKKYKNECIEEYKVELDDKKNTDEQHASYLHQQIEAVYTVLNMLKEKDKEIQFQKDINKQEKDRHKQAEKSLKGQIKTLKRDFKIVDQECSRLERQEAKQDKMIDLILEFLSEIDLGYYTKEEGGEVLGIMRKYNNEIKAFIDKDINN